MLRFEIKTADALTTSERAAWHELLIEADSAPSPYLTPDYFAAVGAARPSARVLIGRRGTSHTLFFPYHRGGLLGALGLGQPIGGAITDLQGIVAAPGTALEPAALMRAAGLGLLSFRHVPTADPVLGRSADRSPTAHGFHAMNLSAGFAAYEAERTPFAKSAFRAIRTRTAKAEERFGPLTMKFRDDSREAFAALCSWKQQQYAATGQTNVLAVDWVRSVIERLRISAGAVRADMSSLWFGERLAAVHLGLRSPTTLHYWFPAYDPELAEISPGNILLYLMAKTAAAEGVREVHLGSGDYRYKLEFANCSRPVRPLLLLAPTLPGRVASAGGRAVGLIERLLPEGLAALPSGAFRRLDRHLAFHAL